MNAAAKAIRAAVGANVWLYRRTNGRFGGGGMGGLPLLLLTVPGRKSGTPHTVPVAYFEHDGGYLIVGTGFGGSRRTPQWFLNLQAAGNGHVQIGGREQDMDARLASSRSEATCGSRSLLVRRTSPGGRREPPAHSRSSY